MKVNVLLAAGTLTALSYASAISSHLSEVLAFEALETLVEVKRALPNAPDGYTPSTVDCPAARPSVRPAAILSSSETSWLEQRRQNTIPAMRELLTRLNISGFDVGSYIDSHSSNSSNLPNIGIAASGGGWRALMNGAGVIQAFDSRTPNSTGEGQLGGLLQSSTYFAGLSGGSWLVGSIYINNFTTIEGLLNTNTGSVWEFGNSVVEGPDKGGIQLLDTTSYYKTLVDEVQGKEDAGFETTITDIWGRALSFQLINATNGGPAYTWSSIAIAENFQNGEIPFPIVIANERAPGETLIAGNTTVYEFNPFEFGSWDPTAYGFVPLKYLGSNFSNGVLPASESCIAGYDNAGFVMGTSSSLFNSLLLRLNDTSLPTIFTNLVTKLLQEVGFDNTDIAYYSPNPLYQYRNQSNPSANSSTLTLVDGGEDGENIPIHPLLQPHRNVDVIFAIDNSADTTNHWPNGTSLVATYERSLPRTRLSNGTVFPSIPDQNTFVNLGLNSRPTFFGCDASNTTGANTPPLIVYIPNAPYSTYSNVSTFQLSTNDSQRDALVLNGYNVGTSGNDTEWTTCAGCAILSRSFYRTGTTVPDACTQCFKRFCWDGTVNSTTPAEYEPTSSLNARNTTSTTSGASGTSSTSDNAGPSLKGSSSTVLAAFVAVVASVAFAM